MLQKPQVLKIKVKVVMLLALKYPKWSPRQYKRINRSQPFPFSISLRKMRQKLGKRMNWKVLLRKQQVTKMKTPPPAQAPTRFQTSSLPPLRRTKGRNQQLFRQRNPVMRNNRVLYRRHLRKMLQRERKKLMPKLRHPHNHQGGKILKLYHQKTK